MADSLIEKINAGGATYVVHDANAVPNTRKINDVVLNTDITLAGDDVKLTGYTKGSSTAAVAATDKVNEAIAKHENRIDTNQTNILSVEDMVCATEFSSSTAYAVGDMVTYEHKLYKFINAHQGAWSASDVQNYDLTQLEAEDRAALAEQVDEGAKNKFDISTATFDNQGGQFSVTYNGDSATIKRISGSATLTTPNFTVRLEPGTYVLSGCPSTGSDSTYRLDLRNSVGTVVDGSIDYGSGSSAFQISETQTYRIALQFANGYTVPAEGITITPMICTKAAFCLSPKFVPYRPSYDDLVNRKPKTVYAGPSQTVVNFNIEYGTGYKIIVQSAEGYAEATAYRTSGNVVLATLVNTFSSNPITASSDHITISPTNWVVITIIQTF